jgi:hypothetical protein
MLSAGMTLQCLRLKMWWQWFQPERDRIAQKIALSAMWNEGYQAGYRTALNQNRCDCGQVHRCSNLVGGEVQPDDKA